MNAAGLSAEDEAFRAEVCAFLDTHLTEDLRAVGRGTTGVFTPQPLALRWHQILFCQGWVAPAWPEEYGGPGWTLAQQYIFASECARAEAPILAAMGLRMVGPVIQLFGDAHQKAFYLPRILSGEDFWCQGYSEPGAGSDLAALQLRAIPDGDDYILQGSKLWTTYAQWANRIFCLARTSQSKHPQQGITFLLVDMETPGIRVKPVITLAGEHEVNEVFFDSVRVPKANRLGDEGLGWNVAKALLEFERGGTQAAFLRARFDRFRAAANDGAAQIALADLDISLTAYESLEHGVLASLSAGRSPGPMASFLKLRASELLQQLTELEIEHFAMAALPAAGSEVARNEPPIEMSEGSRAMARYLNGRAWTIFGGTSEIQRGLMAKLFLKL